jgi:antirestriction protein ArdC
MTAIQKLEAVAQSITKEIIAELEKGEVVWQKGFINVNGRGAENYFSNRLYEGFNQFYLSYRAQKMGYATAQYISFNQAKELGGNVRKGEKATTAIYWKVGKYDTGKKTTEGEAIEKKSFVPFIHYVFNIAQVEGVDFVEQSKPELFDTNTIEVCEKIVAEMQNAPIIKTEGNQPCYLPFLDEIHMPMIGQYKNAERYYKTLFHELAHSTGHKDRLNRFKEENNLIPSFSSESYCREELTAEMGAAILCGHAGIITSDLMENSVAYLQGWMKALKKDSNLIITAANKASKAARFILGIPNVIDKTAAEVTEIA